MDVIKQIHNHPDGFIIIPKLLFKDPRYSEVSPLSKVLYGFLLDRTGLSVKNGWVNKTGQTYIYFSQSEVMERFQCGHDKAVRMMKELENVGLICRIRKGQGRCSQIVLIPISLEV